jgi:hypothetical protein
MLAVRGVGDDGITLYILGVFHGGNLVARHVRFGIGVALHYFIQGRALGIGLVVGA